MCEFIRLTGPFFIINSRCYRFYQKITITITKRNRSIEKGKFISLMIATCLESELLFFDLFFFLPEHLLTISIAIVSCSSVIVATISLLFHCVFRLWRFRKPAFRWKSVASEASSMRIDGNRFVPFTLLTLSCLSRLCDLLLFSQHFCHWECISWQLRSHKDNSPIIKCFRQLSWWFWLSKCARNKI